MVATRPLTITEFAEEHREGRWELIDGEPVEMTPSSDESSWIAGEIFGHLWNYLRTHPIGRVFPADAGFALFANRDTVRAPDVAFVRMERLPALSRTFVTVPPDLAVEVLSPSDRLADALSKVSMYLEAGVPLVWLIDPIRRTAMISRPDTFPVIIDEHGALDGADILPDFSLPLATLFA
jgi:Uma2 family endonuclease